MCDLAANPIVLLIVLVGILSWIAGMALGWASRKISELT
jgi:hypothetical protein